LYGWLRHGEEELVGVGNEDDNKHEEVAYGHHVGEVVGAGADTYTGSLPEAHLEAGSEDVEGDMDTLQQLEENVGTVVEL
jgi:hypothetical protein